MSSPTIIKFVGNFFLIIFPIIFASMVTHSLLIENIKPKDFIDFEDEDICPTKMFVNVSVAIILAAIWNGNRIIKIGVI